MRQSLEFRLEWIKGRLHHFSTFLHIIGPHYCSWKIGIFSPTWSVSHRRAVGTYRCDFWDLHRFLSFYQKCCCLSWSWWESHGKCMKNHWKDCHYSTLEEKGTVICIRMEIPSALNHTWKSWNIPWKRSDNSFFVNGKICEVLKSHICMSQ